jgi:hypothetical protein
MSETSLSGGMASGGWNCEEWRVASGECEFDSPHDLTNFPYRLAFDSFCASFRLAAL